MGKTKIELMKDIERLESEIEGNNLGRTALLQTNEQYKAIITQLQSKLQEVANVVSHYEKTILVLSGRIQEKDTLIKEQREEIKGGKIE